MATYLGARQRGLSQGRRCWDDARNLPVCTSSEAGVDARAEGRLALLAVAAPAIRHVERQHDSVSLLEQRHTRSNLFNDAHVLVTKDQAGLGSSATLVHVEVGACERRTQRSASRREW